MLSDVENAQISLRHLTMQFLIWSSFRRYLYNGNFAPLNESQRNGVMATFSAEQVFYWVETYFPLQGASVTCLLILAVSETDGTLYPLAVCFKTLSPAVN